MINATAFDRRFATESESGHPWYPLRVFNRAAGDGIVFGIHYGASHLSNREVRDLRDQLNEYLGEGQGSDAPTGRQP